jgi:hypothetical protein
MKKIVILFMVYVISGSFMSSCKKDSDGASSAKLIEPGQLISISEALTITGENYIKTETSEQKVVGLKICDYTTSDDGLFQISLTQTAALNGSGLKIAKEFYQSAKANYTDQESVSNVGNDAFISNTNGDLNILYTDNYYITIWIMQEGLFTDPGRWTAAQKKAKKIAAGQKAVENLKKLLAQ